MSSNNPKAFYNQTDYSGSRSTGYRSPSVVHKPDEVSSDLLPPPPYSPDNRKSTDSSTYGSTSNDPQQAGLLAQSSQPFGETRNLFKSVPQHQTTPLYNTQSTASVNPHQEYQVDEEEGERVAPVPVTWYPRKRYACCRYSCKFIFAAILLWLLFLQYGEHLIPDHKPKAPHDSTCASNAKPWDDLPRTIAFERNVEVILEGFVSGGVVTVTPLEDRHGGTINTDITFTPSSFEDQMTYEISQLEDTTRLVLKMPQTRINDDDCINLNMEIRLPYSADLLHLDVHNVQVSVLPFIKDVRSVDIHNANGNIKLDRWTGRQIKLTATNGNINVGRLISDGSIFISTTSGEIMLSEKIEAKNQIDVQNSNGAIKSLGGAIQADDTVNIATSNGIIHLGSVLSDNVYLKTSNGGILVDYIMSKVQVISETANGPIAISVAGEKNNRVVVKTSGSPINLHMTNEFEGRFVMSTSNGKVAVENEDGIEYQDNSDYLKRGERRGTGNKGDLSVLNSNADVNVYFDI